MRAPLLIPGANGAHVVVFELGALAEHLVELAAELGAVVAPLQGYFVVAELEEAPACVQ